MELKIKGETYRTGRLDARKQFHVARRLAPVLVARMQGLAAMAAAFGGKPATKEGEPPPADKPVPENALVAGFMPVAKAISQISDEDADYVITGCLAVCEKAVNGAWAPVQAPNGRLMDSTMDMATMMELVQGVVKENCGDFFPVPSESTAT